MIRSQEITQDFVQVNARVTAYGDKPLEEIFPKIETAEKSAEKQAEPPKDRKRK
jgi:small subunit ribosomal protein S6e